jgi:hypothetical protein
MSYICKQNEDGSNSIQQFRTLKHLKRKKPIKRKMQKNKNSFSIDAKWKNNGEKGTYLRTMAAAATDFFGREEGRLD